MSQQTTAVTSLRPDSDAHTDANVSRVIGMFLAKRGINVLHLAHDVGIPKSRLYDRFAAGGWKATELAAIGAALDVSPGTFFSDPDELLRSRCVSQKALFTVHDGGADGTDDGGGRPVLSLVS